MQTRRFKVLIEWDQDAQAWVTYAPTLGNLSTYGDTREEALDQTREAILGYLEACEKEGLPVPDRESDPELVDVEVKIA